jgi:hypothetical protein
MQEKETSRRAGGGGDGVVVVWFEVRPRRLVLSIVREAEADSDCQWAARSCLRRHGFWGRWIDT